MSMKRIIVDTSVISLLAESKTGKQHLEQQEFYLNHASGCVWYVTPEIISELNDMKARESKRELLSRSLAIVARNKAITLPRANLKPILQRDDVKQALKDHNKTRSDRNDKKNIARAVLEGFQFFSHDEILCKRAKNISGLKLVSWYLKPQKGRKTIKRDKSGNKIGW